LPPTLFLVLVLFSPGCSAQSPYAAEMQTFAWHYHENPARLDGLRAGLEQALATDPHMDNLLAFSQSCFIWGDVRAATRAQKLEAYDKGRQAGRRAVDREPNNAAAHFWYAANTGRLAQIRWAISSLLLLGTLRDEIRILFDLDPKLPAAYALAGNMYYETPGFLGGDLNKAEEMFRKGLALDPKFTGLRVGLGKTLMRKGKIDAGQRELNSVLNEKDPRYLSEWAMKDAKEAAAALDEQSRQNRVGTGS
jgi:tetratricopeptide (TPR) repeat protein